MSRPVRKAVIPAAGFGTRFLPFTKAVPKELVPLVDKPVIQYVVEEAVAAGIDRILIVTSSGKNAIQEHFNRSGDLERRLEETGKTALLAELRAISGLADIHYIYQQELNGLGDAVLCAKSFVGDDPFAVLLGDTVLDSSTEVTVTGQLVAAFGEVDSPVTALEPVPMERVSRYGVMDGIEVGEGLYKVRDWVEKPAPEEAPGNLAIASRYVFTPDIFDFLGRTPRGKGNEIQLTDAMRLMLAERPMYGLRIAGKRYDLGSKLGFLTGTVEFGLRRPEFREAFAAFLKEITREL
ncbi:UTP--glucose-1-phosphate uridylyltransferase GalU [uncultured Victivallis sp.]|uniref:UTP--glucose-1-phosphate uridylyltransferase GalU n=1 Tax=uncultured Victivallis sp. TaxID=354118 RepID=UPI0025E22200|nr:UTP--glucose-1-phosphate uridylyltransferase GalU [uncultured Victivallis sp.]